MIVKEDQARLKALLTEAVRVILKNGLRYNQEITIEGLLGITLDKTDVFLININETVETDVAQTVLPPASQYNNTTLQSYLPKLFEHTSVANVLGLPFVEGLPSLNLNLHEQPTRSVGTKRGGMPPRRRGSSPVQAPSFHPYPRGSSPVQAPPFHPSPHRIQSPVYRTLDPDHVTYEAPPVKRAHYDVTYSNPVPVAPYRHNNEPSNTVVISPETTGNQPPDLITGTGVEQREDLKETGRSHPFMEAEPHNHVRNGTGGSGTSGSGTSGQTSGQRSHSESSSMSDPLSPPSTYSHHMSPASTTTTPPGIHPNQQQHSRFNSQSHTTSSSSNQLPPYHDAIAHVNPQPTRPASLIPPPARDPEELLRAQVQGNLSGLFPKSEPNEDKKMPLPSFQSLTKSGAGGGGGTLPSFSNQFKPFQKSPVTNFPSSSAVLGVATPKIKSLPNDNPPTQTTPPAAIIPPLKIKVENGSKVEPPPAPPPPAPTRGRKPRTPKDTPASEFRCEYCGRVFTSWSGRYFHMASHTGKYKHTCFLCKKGFMQTRLYNIHLQSHQKEYEKSHPNKAAGGSSSTVEENTQGT